MSQPASSAAARVRFRQPLSTAGFVDAAWWPRSRDLPAELPGLLDDLRGITREITRVTFILAAWTDTPRRTTIGNRVVRLGGYNAGNPHIVNLWDSAGRERVDVLVIPPDTDPARAEQTMQIASRNDSLLRADEILAEADAHLKAETPVSA